MSGPFLIIERENAIATVTLNRPSERNAISRPEYIEEIRNFCADATRDPSLKAVIVTGAGSAFCAGGNVKDMRDKAGIFEGSPYTLPVSYTHLTLPTKA